VSATLTERVDGLCEDALGIVAGRAEEANVRDLRARLHEPLRVALAGRVKAGKSTLLNALVGERLAPTDAGECTKLVTWYDNGVVYEVSALLPDGSERPLRFQREDGRLEVELDDLEPIDIERITVRWPSSRLLSTTLIDTPGLEGMDETSATRTLRFLGLEDEGRSDVDAVVYLMRHMHRRDAEFLEAFMDRSLSRPSPVNAIAVLSRADEIGAGRLDALASAQTIAGRYRADDRIRSLCAAVIPVAGLIAETGTTFREDEMETLRSLGTMPAEELTSLLLSVDRFVDPASSPLPSQTRRDLLARLGLFGVRYCLAALREQRVGTATEMSRDLIAASGIDRLSELLEDHFAGRARRLKARSALVGLKEIARTLSVTDPDAARGLAAAVEQVESSAHELAELRLWHLALSGTIVLDPADMDEIRRLTAETDAAARLGVTRDTDRESMAAAAQAGVDRWRTRAAHPMTSREVQEVCEILARSYEGIFTDLAQT